ESTDVVIIFTDGRTFPYGGRRRTILEAQAIQKTTDLYVIKLDNKWGKEGETEIQGYLGNRFGRRLDASVESVDHFLTLVINHFKPCVDSTTTTSKPTTTTEPLTETVTGATPITDAQSTTTEVPTTVTVPPCERKVNLVLVFDTTQSLSKLAVMRSFSSISFEERKRTPIEELQTVKAFTAALVAEFEIYNDASRVAVLTFDEYVKVIQQLKDTISFDNTKFSIMNKAQNWTGAGTRTDRALKVVHDEILTEENGWRPDIPTLVFLATDGFTFSCCNDKCCPKWKYPEDECRKRAKDCITTEEAIKSATYWGDRIKEDKKADFIILALEQPKRKTKKNDEEKRKKDEFYRGLVGDQNYKRDVISTTDFVAEMKYDVDDLFVKIKDRICRTHEVFADAINP
ncbi:unnamed protein product, partial [Owenia fusiformis]